MRISDWSSDVCSSDLIECRFGTGVELIDRAAHSARLFAGTTLEYGKLVLATGGRPRHLSLPGAEHPNVHYVRTIADILRLKAQLEAGKRLVIIGGGYTGLAAAPLDRKNVV